MWKYTTLTQVDKLEVLNKIDEFDELVNFIGKKLRVSLLDNT